jgi:hypothetical protein
MPPSSARSSTVRFLEAAFLMRVSTLSDVGKFETRIYAFANARGSR